MMELRWVIKTTPRVKSVLAEVVIELLEREDMESKIAARLIAEAFDIKVPRV